ncbi:unnamed protein product [Auanema sp. JU1783]|nr:unnamed protein product [Auanema sp. JU1783]
MKGKLNFILLSLLVLLSVHGIVASEKEHNEDDHDEFKAEFGDEQEEVEGFSRVKYDKDGEPIVLREQEGFTKPKPIMAKDLPTMRFIFCVSCGYKNAYEQYSQFVREKYPEMNIEGSNYPPAPWKAYLAQAINILKMVLLFSIVTGASNPLPFLRDLVPLAWAQQNKLSACMMIFLLSNMIESSLMSTGAFEVYLGDEQIWSKIESGRVPSPPELLQMVDAQLELLGKVPMSISGGFGAAADFNN